ncbi:MAG: hypothetical protein ACYCZX_01625 [Rhodospirillaceae bacterium]
MKNVRVAAATLLATTALSTALIAAPAAAADNTTAREIQMLQDQLRTLQQQLDALKANDQTAHQAALDAVARESKERQAADNAAAAAPPPKPPTGWWTDTVISGRMYANLSDSEHKVNGVDQADNGVGLDIKRFYLGVDHKFNSIFSGNITTDFNYDSGPAGATQIYLKKAYLEAKLDPAFTIRVGSADLPWVPFVEGVYNYRHLENVMIDRTKFGTSADWGVHALGSFENGLVSYQVSVVDGSGYKHPLRTNSVDVEGRVNVNYQGFIAALGGYSGKLGKDIQGAAPTYHRAERFDALAAYVGHGIRVGAEYFVATAWNDVAAVTSNRSNGYSFFGSYDIMPMFNVFARYESVKPKENRVPALKDDYYTLGITYTPTKIVDISLAYKHDKAVNGTISTSNGTIGGSINGTYSEIGVWTQMRW